jgi:hypothetical protein
MRSRKSLTLWSTAMKSARLLLIALSLPVLLTTLSCNKIKRTISIKAATTYTVSHPDSKHKPFPCLFHGGAPDACQRLGADPGSGQVRVGFVKAYDGGSWPLYCWAWLSCKKRGYVTFDLSPLKGKEIVSATLKYKVGPTVMKGNTGGATSSCALKLYVSTTGIGWETPGELITGDLPDGTDNSVYLVTPIVRDWVAEKVLNHGFLFVGDEDHPNENQDQCVSTLHDFTLLIQYVP